jgi:hypothetical protein
VKNIAGALDKALAEQRSKYPANEEEKIVTESIKQAFDEI